MAAALQGQDYYDVLGVPRDCSVNEIRTKFRQLIVNHHPDKGGDGEAFQILNQAYNTLTDPEKRAHYDKTGRDELSVEEEFAKGFGAGRMARNMRPKEADAQAVVNMAEQVSQGPTAHNDNFEAWMRERDTSEMVMTDKDFMKTALFNAADSATDVRHRGHVQHVLGSPKTDAYGKVLPGPVQVNVKPRPVKRTLDHDEILIRMLAVPLDDAMVYADLNQTSVCLGHTGIGRVEQTGARAELYKEDDCVIILPKPTKYAGNKPIGTARTLVVCNQDDIVPIPAQVLEELTPEQLCLTPNIVCAYVLLESFGSTLQPGDSVLMNAAHRSAVGSSMLQLCKLLNLRALCILDLQGAPKTRVKGEYGSKAAWQEAENKTPAPPSVREQYKRISEWLVSMGAEEVFPDAAAVLRWRDRNQRLLPKLGLDGIATRESTEQLIHCLDSGDKNAKCVVYGGYGGAQPIAVAPRLLSSWAGTLEGFSIARWVHALSANAAKMMAVMDSVTKLVRGNKFSIETVLYKVGEDAISDAFMKAAEASNSSQVVLIFPTLQEETENNGNIGAAAGSRAAGGRSSRSPTGRGGAAQSPRGHGRSSRSPTGRGDLEDPTDKIRREWLKLLFTGESEAAKNPEDPMAVACEYLSTESPSSIVIWLGEDMRTEHRFLEPLMAEKHPSAGMACLSWTDHVCADFFGQIDVQQPSITDGSWYAQDGMHMSASDLDMLHDIELTARSMVMTIEETISKVGLTWADVVLTGFGKGAGIAMYAALLGLLPAQVAGAVFMNAIVPFPMFLGEKSTQFKGPSGGAPVKMFTVWGSHDRATPASYRQMLANTLRKYPNVQCTPDTLPDNAHVFDQTTAAAFGDLLSLAMRR